MKILLTFALESECGNIVIPGHELETCLTGVGKVSAALNTYKACLEVKPDLVLALGTAGTLHHAVGDRIVCSRFQDRDLEEIAHLGVEHVLDFQTELSVFQFDQDISGCVSSGDTFQTEIPQSGLVADVFDMEAFGSAQACKILGLPFIAVKYVTDIIGQNSLKHWEEKLEEARMGLEQFLVKFQIKSLDE